MTPRYKVESATIQAGNAVVFTNVAGYGVITFPHPYLVAPVVVAWGGNGESVTSTDPAATTTGFAFQAWSQSGSLLASVPVRILWIAHPVTT